MNRVFGFVVVILILLSSCTPPVPPATESIPFIQGEADMQVRELWMSPVTRGANGAVYFVIQNHSEKYDELFSAFSDLAQAVELHVSRIDGNLIQMHPVQSIPLKADAEAAFFPGGLHLMLIGLKQERKVGQSIKVTLQFKRHAEIIITVPVQEIHGDYREEALQRLTHARQKWQNAKIHHYRFRLNIQCICLASQYMPLIEVQNGEIVSMKLAEGSDVEETTLQEVRDIGTIDKLFDFVAGVLRGGGGDVFSVEYDDTYGFPSYFWDSDIEAIDDESKVFVSDFEVLP